MNLEQKHAQVLYPVVRVKAKKAGGSGTVIYSQPDPKREGEYLTFVMTNEHVVDDAISTVEEWDSLLKRKKRVERLQKVNVEMFDYVKMSHVNTSNSCPAEIVAYDKNEDIAIVKLESIKEYPHPAKLIPRELIEGVKVFHPIYSCGCSLLHDPFANPGFITYLDEMIENRKYWMANSNSIFGNSGGAVFTADEHHFIGIPSRITGIQLGFGIDIITWMGFFVPPERIYEFLDKQELMFLFDPEDDYYAALERREKKQKQALAALAAELSRGEEE